MGKFRYLYNAFESTGAGKKGSLAINSNAFL